MQSLPGESYLAMQVRTAPPQKLHLMLLDAALRSARRTADQWRDGQDEGAFESLLHAQEVVNELICGMKLEEGPELARKVGAIYAFIYRSLVEAGRRHDQKSLDDAVRILEIERETWRQLCEKLASTGPDSSHTRVPPPKSPVLAGREDLDFLPSAGLSLEA